MVTYCWPRGLTAGSYLCRQDCSDALRSDMIQRLATRARLLIDSGAKTDTAKVWNRRSGVVPA
jgi:hypothetical protein